MEAVHIYRNLNKKCWSVRKRGLVIAHMDELTLKNATMHVQPAGHAKVIREQRKSVHAYIKGDIVQAIIKDSQPLTYNPYVANFFFNPASKKEISECNYVIFHANGKVSYK